MKLRSEEVTVGGAGGGAEDFVELKAGKLDMSMATLGFQRAATTKKQLEVVAGK